jgi:hypothetical protein
VRWRSERIRWTDFRVLVRNGSPLRVRVGEGFRRRFCLRLGGGFRVLERNKAHGRIGRAVSETVVHVTDSSVEEGLGVDWPHVRTAQASALASGLR